MSTWIKAGFWQTLCPGCSGYKGWLNLTEFVKKIISGGGTTNTLPKFGPDGNLVDSSISDTGTLVTVNSASRISGEMVDQTITNPNGLTSTGWTSSLIINPNTGINDTTSAKYYYGSVYSVSAKGTNTGSINVNGHYILVGGSRDVAGTFNLNGLVTSSIKNTDTDVSTGGSIVGCSNTIGHGPNLNNSVASSTVTANSIFVNAQKGTITTTRYLGGRLTVSGAVGSSGVVNTHTSFYSEAIIGRSDGTTVGTVTNFYDAYLSGATVHPNSSITNRWGTYQANANHANYFAGNIIVGSNPVDTGDKFQVQGAIRTENPVGGTSQPWKLGSVSATTPTSPNVTIEVEINGVTYYLHAKTTND